MYPYLFYKNCADMMGDFDGSGPFHLFLKERFRENKNWGSKDRKRYRSCCYYFWRNAIGISRSSNLDIITWLQLNYSTEENLSNETSADASTEINTTSSADFHLKSLTPPEKVGMKMPKPAVESQPYHQFSNNLSSGLTPESLLDWFTTEPLVWFRAIDGKDRAVTQQLQKLNINIEQKTGHSYAVNAQANLNPITDFGYAYIQDISSQTAMDWKNLPLHHLCSPNNTVWDCCAGAGGKSITLLQNHPKSNVLCSDVRANVLENLQKRFQILQMPKPRTKVFDLSLNDAIGEAYDIVIADVPCSGSGTWRRNPENIHFFSAMEINLYAQKQQAILKHIPKAVKIGGYLVYMTCSIFADENEDNIEYFLKNHENYVLVQSELIGGILLGGDYIFRSILQRLV